MSQNCPFCKIISGELPARIVYCDDDVTAFWDRAPIAPVHILIVPKEHISSLNDASASHQKLLGHILLVAQQIAQEQGVDQSGYRVLINTGADGGQSVLHLHLHLIGGRRFPMHMATQ
jgi:histidine triad (HIT) family protein